MKKLPKEDLTLWVATWQVFFKKSLQAVRVELFTVAASQEEASEVMLQGLTAYPDVDSSATGPIEINRIIFRNSRPAVALLLGNGCRPIVNYKRLTHKDVIDLVRRQLTR